MKLTPDENVLRVALIVFSVIFGLLSVSLIALGIAYIDEIWWPRKYVGLDFLELPTLIIILGTLSLLMSIAGCFCAKSYNRKILLVYGIILFAILCLEMTVAVIAFINFDEHELKHSRTDRLMLDQIGSANNHTRVQFEEIEEHFKCCGVYGDEEKCTNQSSFLVIPGCADVIDTEIQTIASESGYFAIALCVLQVGQIFYVYSIIRYLDY